TVACERSDCPVSLTPHFARYHLSTVDGVDTPLGKIALVYALAGRRGHYGTKPTAEKVLPDLEPVPVPQPVSAQ
ncbi:MAG: copper transporter, partial [Armatimonadota bacterium]|nr:copper transporter [Armatimonadota bacterium]